MERKKTKPPFLPALLGLHCLLVSIEPPLVPPDRKAFVSNKGLKSNPEWRRGESLLFCFGGGLDLICTWRFFLWNYEFHLFSYLSTAAFNKILENPIKAAKPNELYLQFDDSCAGARAPTARHDAEHRQLNSAVHLCAAFFFFFLQ